MALVKTGNGIVDIRGSVGGVHFKRDRTGLHCCRAPRKVAQTTTLQRAQRNAFMAAKAYGGDNRTVSYNIFRSLSGLPLQDPPIDYQPDMR